MEQIREGDLVWSQHETIETTAAPPFYTKEGWKDAADLTKQYHIQTKNKKWYCVKGQNFLYTKKKVYSFEVEDWHTYFVGKLAWLVHNAQPCFFYNDKRIPNMVSKYHERTKF